MKPISPCEIRAIGPSDDESMARIIRTVMPAFGASGAGFAISDPEVDHMSAAYAEPRTVYYVLDCDGVIVGGAGIAPLTGGPEDTCELRKMYFLPTARGQGLGQKLLDRCLAAARERGFRRCYIETLTGMDAAMRLYERNGFERLTAPLGATGHFSCDHWYIKSL